MIDERIKLPNNIRFMFIGESRSFFTACNDPEYIVPYASIYCAQSEDNTLRQLYDTEQQAIDAYNTMLKEYIDDKIPKGEAILIWRLTPTIKTNENKFTIVSRLALIPLNNDKQT
jgi:hypothetical protein